MELTPPTLLPKIRYIESFRPLGTVIRPSTFHSFTQLSDSARLLIMYLFMYCYVNCKLCLTKYLQLLLLDIRILK